MLESQKLKSETLSSTQVSPCLCLSVSVSFSFLPMYVCTGKERGWGVSHEQAKESHACVSKEARRLQIPNNWNYKQFQGVDMNLGN